MRPRSAVQKQPDSSNSSVTTPGFVCSRPDPARKECSASGILKTLNAAVSFAKHRLTILKLNFTRKQRVRYALKSLAINGSPPSEPHRHAVFLGSSAELVDDLGFRQLSKRMHYGEFIGLVETEPVGSSEGHLRLVVHAVHAARGIAAAG